MTDTLAENTIIGQHVSLTLKVAQAQPQQTTRTHCEVCWQPVYAMVFHKCPGIEARPATPPTAYDSGVFSEPPKVVQTAQRTECDACGGALAPDVKHVCAGNERWHP